MIYLIVGHRGTGKTLLLSILQNSLEQGRFIDLDAYIEQEEKMKIAEIFEKKGEVVFRQLEVSYFNDLVSKYYKSSTDTYISLGAGFVGRPPEGTRTIWLRRPTDKMGRVFLDRPRLSKMQSSIEEYDYFFKEREKRYIEWADEIIERPEGLKDSLCLGEKLFWGLESPTVGGVLTLMPEFLPSEHATNQYLKKRLGWKEVTFELRSDLLSSDQMRWACHVIPYERRIVSLRKGRQVNLIRSMAPIWDWALELGLPSEGEDPSIISQHDRYGQSFGVVLDHLNEVGQKWPVATLKLAVEINSFEELKEGHQWWSVAPDRRVFLPRSSNGRWSWYRQLMGKKMNLAFWREGPGSAADQPTLSEWLAISDGWENFAAVLGDPITQSWTPVEQSFYFAQREMPVVAIQMGEEELSHGTLEFLGKMGLVAAAITSPLKVKARSVVDKCDPLAEKVGSANTLVLGQDCKWWAYNTDRDGLQALLAEVSAGANIAVWGGGGTRGVLQELLPKACFYSARKGELLRGPDLLDFRPSVLIWAVGRSRQSSSEWPHKDWSPELVIDLNYTSDSPGIEYAAQCGAQHKAGEQMFRAQAAAQRRIWSHVLDG